MNVRNYSFVSKLDQETTAYGMTVAEIATHLGTSEKTVVLILRKAIAKLRAHPQLCIGLREAVREKRRALDMRPGNGPWHYARAMRWSVQDE